MSDDSTRKDRRPLVRTAERSNGPEIAVVDWRLRNLSERTGLQRLAMLQGQLDSAAPPCRLPTSGRKEIILQVVSGTGELECDGQRVPLSGGDLLSLSHPDNEPTLYNTGNEPLVWFLASH